MGIMVVFLIKAMEFKLWSIHLLLLIIYVLILFDSVHVKFQ